MWSNPFTTKGMCNVLTYKAPTYICKNKNWFVGLTKTDIERMNRWKATNDELAKIAVENVTAYLTENNIIRYHTPLRCFVETFEYDRIKEILRTCKVPKDLDEKDFHNEDIYLFKDKDGKARLVIQPRTVFVRETYLNTLPTIFEECDFADIPGWIHPLPDSSEFIRGIELKLR